MKSEIIYSGQKTNFVPGHRYANPRLFNRPRANVTSVIVVGDWPQVVQAYQRADVPVRVVEDEEALEAYLVAREPENAQASAPAPADRVPIDDEHDDKTPLLAPLPPVGEVQDLEWPILKSLAEEVAGHYIRSRSEAVEIIEDERRRRAEGV